jgi:AAHS family 4-hydroxybenzoate transporter-like MFS transporter
MNAARAEIAAPQAALSRTSVLVAALCALVAMLDGFDAQAIAYVGPLIAEKFGMRPSALAPAFAAGLVGTMAGALLLSPAADRFGRKTLILISTVIFAVFSLATASAEDLRDLMIFRLLTGVGLGAALPNLISLTSEYSPPRWRASVVTVMSCGFPLGAVIGGFMAGPLISAYGWPAIFVVGGLMPLLILPALIFLMPESQGLLGAGEAARARTPMPVLELFRDGRTLATLLVWIIYGLSFLVTYFLVNWLPILLREAGLPLRLAIYSTAILNVGAIVGALVMAWCIDRWNAYAVLGSAYAMSAGFILSIGFAMDAPALLLLGAGLAGFGVFGAIIACNALAASLYPLTIRSTGVGWAAGVGRIGAIAGPLIGGMLLAENWRPQSIIMAAAAPALLTALAVLILGVARERPRSTTADGQTETQGVA